MLHIQDALHKLVDASTLDEANRHNVKEAIAEQFPFEGSDEEKEGRPAPVDRAVSGTVPVTDAVAAKQIADQQSTINAQQKELDDLKAAVKALTDAKQTEAPKSA